MLALDFVRLAGAKGVAVKKPAVAQCIGTPGDSGYTDIELGGYIPLGDVLGQQPENAQAIFDLLEFLVGQYGLQRRFHLARIADGAEQSDQFLAGLFACIHVLVQIGRGGQFSPLWGTRQAQISASAQGC